MKRLAVFVVLCIWYSPSLLFAENTQDEKAIRELVAEWGPALNQENAEKIASQFHPHADGVDSRGIRLCCGPSAMPAFLRKDLAVFFRNKKHSVVLEDVRFVTSEFALVRIAYTTSNKTGPSSPSQSPMRGILRKEDGRWRWISVWPFLPVGRESRPAVEMPGLLDGTQWIVQDGAGKPVDKLLFEGGRLISLEGIRKTTVAKGNMETFAPDFYSSEKIADKIVWSSTQSSLSNLYPMASTQIAAGSLYKYWTGEVSGVEMSGRFTEDDLEDELDEGFLSQTWTAVRSQ